MTLEIEDRGSEGRLIVERTFRLEELKEYCHELEVHGASDDTLIKIKERGGDRLTFHFTAKLEEHYSTKELTRNKLNYDRNVRIAVHTRMVVMFWIGFIVAVLTGLFCWAMMSGG